MTGRVARNTSWMMVSQVARLGLQAAYFVIVARTLGATAFGQFAAVAALVNIVLPFAPLGSGVMMVRDVARDPGEFAAAWGGTLAATLVFGSLLTAASCGVAALLFPGSIPFVLVACVGVADLIFYNISNAAGQAFQGVERLDRTALTVVVLSAARCVAAVGFAVVGSAHDAAAWSAWYLAGTALAGLWSLAYVTRVLGRPRLSLRQPLRRAREGAYFAVSLMTFTVYTDIDKTMLARLASLDAAGVYTAGYRVVTFATMPIMALVSATFPEFFVRGQGGLRATSRYAWQLMRFTLAYAVVAAVALVALSPLASWALGSDYAPSELVIRALAIVVVAQAAHLLLANALTGADRQGTRTIVQVAVALVNVALNMWLIPIYAMNAAIITTLVSEIGLVAVLAIVISIMVRREPSATVKEAG